MPLSSIRLALSRRLGRRAGLFLAVGLTLVVAALGYKLVPRVYNARKLESLQGRKVYDEHARAEPALERALSRALAEHKRVMVIMGGNWCRWCLTLDALFESDRALAELVHQRFVLLKLDAEAASSLDEKWGKPSTLGVPVVIFLEPNGRLVHTLDLVPLEKWGGRLLAYDRDELYQALSRSAQ